MSARRLAPGLTAAMAIASSFARADAGPPPSPHTFEIRGSATMAAVLRPLAEAYMTAHPEEVITVSACGIPRAIQSLVQGTSEMAMDTDDLPDESVKLAEDRNVKLDKAQVYREAIAIVVDPSNPVGGVSLAQVDAIFRGAVTDWKQAGGAAGPIEVLAPPADTGASEVFKDRVLGPDAVITPHAAIVPREKLKSAMHAGGISYVAASWLPSLGLKALTIDGVAGDARNVGNGKYPITGVMNVYQRSPATPLGESFVGFLRGPDGARAILAAGGVPMGATR